MDASTYLRRKKESLGQYIHKPAFMDAGARTEMVVGKAAANAYYVSPATAFAPIAKSSCTTCGSTGYSGSASAQPYKAPPGCCVTRDTTSITRACCPMIYEASSTYTPACKVTEYCAPRTAQTEAVALHTCNTACPPQ
jgi:hypothetical protein